MRFTSRVLSVLGRVVAKDAVLVAPVALFALFATGCLAQDAGVLPPLHRSTPDAGPPPLLFVDASTTAPIDASLPDLPPHSVIGVDPAHGPFTGGDHAIVRGTGFSSAVRVWFGDAEVPHDAVVPIDPGHVQVTVPPGHAGTVDVSAENGTDDSTRATLHQGYVYDSFYVDPSTGPVSGGTLITLYGDGTHWDPSTRVLIDTSECTVVAIRGPTSGGAPQELDCKTPPGTAGAKRVRVLYPGGAGVEAGAETRFEDVLDGFVYGDSSNGFLGGLSGDPLSGSLRVVVLNSSTGRALGGATVILGGDVTASSVKTADGNGVVALTRQTDPSLGSKVTVTVVAPCFMPTTFVDVPVDTVTAYLDPILSPDCLPKNGGGTGVGTGGGSPQAGATIEGELVWSGGIEFKIAPWDVPEPAIARPDGSTDVRRAAYVFALASSGTQAFRLPAASQGVTPEDVGHIGYTFKTTTGVGNLTLYALAGIEDRRMSPPLFTAYTLGVLSGVGTTAGSVVKDVYIPMNLPLDHAMVLDVTGPTPNVRGPDRVVATVGIRVGTLGYVVLPVGSQSSLLPTTVPLSFVGLPPLSGNLRGAEYVTTTTASTGESHTTPRSVLGSIATTAPAGPLQVNGFMEVPLLDVPAADGAWNGQDLSVSAAPGGPDPDLTVFQIQSGAGLSSWTVTLPKGVTRARLPDLGAVPSLAGLAGPVSIAVARATLANFSYGALRYSQLSARGWTAYATDVFQAHH